MDEVRFSGLSLVVLGGFVCFLLSESVADRCGIMVSILREDVVLRICCVVGTEVLGWFFGRRFRLL